MARIPSQGPRSTCRLHSFSVHFPPRIPPLVRVHLPFPLRLGPFDCPHSRDLAETTTVSPFPIPEIACRGSIRVTTLPQALSSPFQARHLRAPLETHPFFRVAPSPSPLGARRTWGPWWGVGEAVGDMWLVACVCGRSAAGRW